LLNSRILSVYVREFNVFSVGSFMLENATVKIDRIKHATIPASDFKPDKTSHRSKLLRWFQNENLKHPDCTLSVAEEHNGEFVLWAHFVAVPLNVSTASKGSLTVGAESLAQSIVDQIEVAPVSNLTRGCDFVIFQDSPLSREFCQRKVQ